jgi:hypothetical protein
MKQQRSNYLVLLTARLPWPFFGGPFPRRLSISSLVRRLHSAHRMMRVVKTDLSQHTIKHQISLPKRKSFVYGCYEWYHGKGNKPNAVVKMVRTVICYNLVMHFTAGDTDNYNIFYLNIPCRWFHGGYAKFPWHEKNAPTGKAHAKMVNWFSLWRHDNFREFCTKYG